MTGVRLPTGDPSDFVPVLTVVRPAVRAAAAPFPHPLGIAKVVADARGAIGMAVELPDVYVDTARVLRQQPGLGDWRHPAATAGAIRAARARFDELLTAVAADLAAAGDAGHLLRGPGHLLRGAGHAVLRHGEGSVALHLDRFGLRLESERVLAPVARVRALAHYAARLNADVRLARLELRAAARRDIADCGFVARLPLAPLRGDTTASLRTAVWMCLGALAAVARAVPPLPVLLDREHQALLGLVADGAAV